MKLSRRNFLKALATAGAAATLPVSALASPADLGPTVTSPTAAPARMGPLFMRCNGAALDPERFPTLFKEVGYRFGRTLDDKFCLPNLDNKEIPMFNGNGKTAKMSPLICVRTPAEAKLHGYHEKAVVGEVGVVLNVVMKVS